MKASFAYLLVAVLSMSSSVFAAPATLSQPAEISLQVMKRGHSMKDAQNSLHRVLARYGDGLHAKRDTSHITLTTPTIHLLGNVNVGDQDISLIFDTGSADLNINHSDYTPGDSAHDTGETFHNAYGQGDVSDRGKIYLDTVKIGSTTIQEVPALRANSNWWRESDRSKGIFGLSFPRENHGNYSTFLEQYFEQFPTHKKQFATWIGNASDATMHLGGYDAFKFTGSLTYTDIDPSHAWWTIPSGGKINGNSVSAIIDSGTYPIFAPDRRALRDLARDLGIKTRSEGDLLTIDVPCSANPVITVSFNGLTRTIPNIHLDDENYYCQIPVYAHNNNRSIANGNWVFGLPVYNQFFILHDYESKRVGFGSPNI